jgi:hypothetical protein
LELPKSVESSNLSLNKAVIRWMSVQMNMELADIPGTSLKVSPVAIGTWAIGG